MTECSIEAPRGIRGGNSMSSRRRSTIRGDKKTNSRLKKNGFAVLQGHWSSEDVEGTDDHIQNVVFPETIEGVKKAYVSLGKIVE
jgi:hypothetical protein